MLVYGLNVFWLSALISLITAALLFLSVRRFIVRPISRVVENMIAWREAPDDPRRVILPSAGVTELRHAETVLADLQTQLSASLRHRERLASLGGAVARISHDLRNMLTTAQLLADRLEASADPTVQRTAPKLIGSISRAINLCENTLAFGKAEEMPPELAEVNVAALVDEVFDAVVVPGEDGVALRAEIAPGLTADADPDHMFRVLTNLVRNARQAIAATGQSGEVRISASGSAAGCEILVSDSGPGFSERARSNLFKPFEGGARKGGTGLGLVIAVDLVRGHGGVLELAETSDQGTVFRIFLPARPPGNPSRIALAKPGPRS
jgi:signal transduction histidine kinase